MNFKILTLILTAAFLAGCAKTIKLSDEDAQRLTNTQVKIVENNRVFETRSASSGAENGLIGVLVTTGLNAAAGTYDELKNAPIAKVDPQIALRNRLTKHLKAVRGIKFKGRVKGPYTKLTSSEEKRAKALVQFARLSGYKGYYLDVLPQSNHAAMVGAGWFAALNHSFRARALLVSAETGKIAAAATCFVQKRSDLTEFSKSSQKNADRLAREIGEDCADYIIQKIF